MAGSVQGKIALITGAARGQGRSHALRLAQQGADILAVDICRAIPPTHSEPATEADLLETVRLVEAVGRRIVTKQADVRNRSEIHSAVEQGVAELGGLHIVVANAGICPIGTDLPSIAFLNTVSVNLVGVINTVEAAFLHLSHGASIVITGSLASLRPGVAESGGAGPGGSGYSHAKRAVARFVHDLAVQLAPEGIRVNAVHPGNVRTDMLLNPAMYKVFRPDLESPTRADAEPAMAGMHRLPINLVEPEDVSNAVLFLASQEARVITGMQLGVDGGALLVRPPGVPD